MRTRSKAKATSQSAAQPVVETQPEVPVAPVVGDAPSRAFATETVVKTLLDVLEAQSPRSAFYWRGAMPIAALARVNKFISPHALARLWRVVYDVDNLLRVLPSTLIAIPQSDWILNPGPNDDGKCRLLRRVTPRDMERYLYYSQFVEEIDMLNDDFVLKSEGLMMVTDFIWSTRTQKSHLQNLKTLALPIKSWPPVVNFIDYFRNSKSLETFEIFGERVYTWSEEADIFVEAVPKLFPALKNLCISGSMPYDARTFTEGLKPGLAKYRKLEVLDLEVTENTLEYLFNDIGDLRALVSLRLNLCNDKDAPGGADWPSEEHSGENTDDAMDLDSVGVPTFFSAWSGASLILKPSRAAPKRKRKHRPGKNFKKLVLNCYCLGPIIEALELVQEKKIQLTNLAVFLRDQMASTQVAQLIKTIVEACPKTEVLNIDDTDAGEDQEYFFEEAVKEKTLGNYIIPHATLKLLGKLTQLTTLNLRTTASTIITSEILDLFAKSCPKLEYCSLSPSNRITTKATKGFEQATLVDVINFVVRLPKLDHLCISFDGRKPKMASTSSSSVSRTLKDLNVGSSLINDAPYVASLISAAFPVLESLDWESNEFVKVVRMSAKEEDLWKEVKSHVLPSSN